MFPLIKRSISLLLAVSLVLSTTTPLHSALQNSQEFAGHADAFQQEALSLHAAAFRPIYHGTLVSIAALAIAFGALVRPAYSQTIQTPAAEVTAISMPAENRMSPAQLYQAARNSTDIGETLALLNQVVTSYPNSSEYPSAVGDLWKWKFLVSDPTALETYRLDRTLRGLTDSDLTPKGDLPLVHALHQVAGNPDAALTFYRQLLANPNISNETRFILQKYIELSPLAIQHGDGRRFALRRDVPVLFVIDSEILNEAHRFAGLKPFSKGNSDSVYRVLKDRKVDAFRRLVDRLNADVFLPQSNGQFSLRFAGIRFDAPKVPQNVPEGTQRKALKAALQDSLNEGFVVIFRMTGNSFSNEYVGDNLIYASPVTQKEGKPMLLSEAMLGGILGHEVMHGNGMMHTNDTFVVSNLNALRAKRYRALENFDPNAVTLDNPNFLRTTGTPANTFNELTRYAAGWTAPNTQVVTTHDGAHTVSPASPAPVPTELTPSFEDIPKDTKPSGFEKLFKDQSNLLPTEKNSFWLGILFPFQGMAGRLRKLRRTRQPGPATSLAVFRAA